MVVPALPLFHGQGGAEPRTGAASLAAASRVIAGVPRVRGVGSRSHLAAASRPPAGVPRVRGVSPAIRTPEEPRKITLKFFNPPATLQE